MGNSVHAPKGRWAEGRDIQWYNRGQQEREDIESRRKERMDVKQAEKEAMERMLYVGYTNVRGRGLSDGKSTKEEGDVARTGANAAPIDPSKRRYPTAPQEDQERRRSRHHRYERSHRRHERERSPQERHRHRHHHRRDHDGVRHRE